MPVVAFTDRGVKALPAPSAGQTDYFDAGAQPPGFCIRVSYKGTRTWMFLYRYNGLKRRMKLGTVRELGLREARDLAWGAHEAVRGGDDPASERRTRQAKVDTIEDLAKAYIAEYAKRQKSSWLKDQQILNREVIPFIGRKRAVDVTRADIRD